MTDDLAYMAAVILMPIVPALLLFKLIPSSGADAEGPFQGLKLKLGGAFAGYFVVVLVAFAEVKLILEPARVQIWQLRGSVSFADGEGAGSPITAALVQIEPPHSNIKDSQGRFGFPLTIKKHHLQDELPNLYVSCQGYRTVSLEIDPDGDHLAAFPDPAQKNVHIDDKHLVIDVGTIVLQKASKPAQ